VKPLDGRDYTILRQSQLKGASVQTIAEFTRPEDFDRVLAEASQLRGIDSGI